VPLALLHLSAWLKKEGVPSHIIDVKEKIFDNIISKKEVSRLISKIVDRLKKINPEYVGITSFTYDYNAVVELARSIKLHLKTKIIVGGTHATCKPMDFLYEGSPFDYVVKGEGEGPLTELLLNDKINKSPEKIPGLGYMDKNGNFRINENTFMPDYALIPMLPYEKIDMDFYTTPNIGLIRSLYVSGIHMLTTRGCPFSCTFCANSLHKISYRPIKAVVDEIEFLKNRYNIDAFYIQDDTFGIKKDRVVQFLDELDSRKLRLVWAMETRVNLVDEDLIKRLAKGHCIQIDFGVESGSQPNLDRMKKGIKVEDTIKTFDLCHKYKIRTLATIMFNTPEETEEDVYKTIALIERIRPSVIGTALTLPFPGTQIYDQYVKPELDKSEYYLFENENMFTRILDKRFMLARHNMDLTKVLSTLSNKYLFYKMKMYFTANLQYWKVLTLSKRKGQYIYNMVSDPIRRMCVYIYKKLR